MSIRAGVIGVGLLGERYCDALRRHEAVELKTKSITLSIGSGRLPGRLWLHLQLLEIVGLKRNMPGDTHMSLREN